MDSENLALAQYVFSVGSNLQTYHDITPLNVQPGTVSLWVTL